MNTNNRTVWLQQHVVLLTVMERAEDLIQKTPRYFILCVFFWVFPRRQILLSRRFGTLCRFHLQGLDVKCGQCEDARFLYQCQGFRSSWSTNGEQVVGVSGWGWVVGVGGIKGCVSGCTRGIVWNQVYFISLVHSVFALADLAGTIFSRCHVTVCKMRRCCVTSEVLSVVLPKFQVGWIIRCVSKWLPMSQNSEGNYSPSLLWLLYTEDESITVNRNI
jgi:hypothetical protein